MIVSFEWLLAVGIFDMLGINKDRRHVLLHFRYAMKDLLSIYFVVNTFQWLVASTERALTECLELAVGNRRQVNWRFRKDLHYLSKTTRSIQHFPTWAYLSRINSCNRDAVSE